MNWQQVASTAAKLKRLASALHEKSHEGAVVFTSEKALAMAELLDSVAEMFDELAMVLEQ